MDGAPMRSIAISRDKAFTCIYMDRDTHVFRAMMDKFDFKLDWFGNPSLTALPGGVRVKDDQGCPPRQNSCRPDMIWNLGAIRTKDGSVRRSIQEQGGGAVVAPGERQCWLGVKRDRSFGADIGTMA